MPNRVLYKNLAYDPDKDFVLISTMSPGSLVFVAHKSTGATNVKEFVEYARKNKTSIGTWGAGSGPHIAHCGAEQAVRSADGGHALSRHPTDVQDFDAGVIQAGLVS